MNPVVFHRCFVCSGTLHLGADILVRNSRRGSEIAIAEGNMRMRTVLKNSCPLVMVLCLLVLTISLGEALAGKIGPESGLSTDRKLPKLIDLGAKKCIPCKMMAPILDELTKEYKGVFEVEFIDVWQPENKGKALAHGIRSIPTQIFLDASGKSLFRHEGFISKEDILKKWKELGFTFLAVQEEEDKKSSSGSESE